ncbi:hypothetical protein [Lentzea sp. NBRC 102530]|uniref:hypothetical protein n=1 Tax=Lentzea sp. NBRC 102530 TaxID=3032201 RepID=UPI0024A48B23|nr:hypothetical protein [Lentzea sp. NBRC 102530]GLY51208.1 hypothetical protein Lesp01_48640 [Lentzea sp. NBRC 102530]
MSDDEREAPKVENVAHGPVGIQAEVVHDSTVYVTYSDTAPDQKYRVGVRFLDDGVPASARLLIGEAIAHGYETAEVRFHWLLAMFSKRSLRDLTAQEQDQLELASRNLDRYGDDLWKQALAAVFSLLEDLRDGDCSVALKQLRELPNRQRDKILRHLDLVITGAGKESLWTETRDMAERLRCSGDRLERVWAYFEPSPAGARARPPVEDRTAPGDHLRSWAWTVLTVTALGYLGWVAVRHAPLMVVACAVAAVGAYVGISNWMEWRYRSERLAAKERDFIGRGSEQSGDAGFARKVSSDFAHYFAKYLPDGVSREQWRAITAGISKTLRDEVVEIYREERVSAEKVKWLVRHLASDVRTRYVKGTLFEHRATYRVRAATKAWCTTGFLLGGAAVAWLGFTAVTAEPWFAALAILIAAPAGRMAAVSWYWTFSETRRAVEDGEEHERRLGARRAAYDAWKYKVESTRPSESEMESWLTYDRTVLLEKALRHYGLAWRDIITHAFLSSPARSYKRARVRYGPWRYSKYDVRLFLITHDGVREVATELDFEHAELGGQERTNFRFDAVSSVHVVQSSVLGCKLELTLFNGPSRNIKVVDADLRGEEAAEDDETAEKPAETSIDSAGFAHTLHILEGIAAEGKNWIRTADSDAR